MRAESALRESQERAGALLESPFEAIVITDGQGRIVSVNANALALFGYGRDELLGQPVPATSPTGIAMLPTRSPARWGAACS